MIIYYYTFGEKNIKPKKKKIYIAKKLYKNK